MMTNSDIRRAILGAADRIEREPNRFEFLSTTVPSLAEGVQPKPRQKRRWEGTDGVSGCGACGCVLGWISAYMECKTDTSFVQSTIAMGITESEFYARMDALQNSRDWRLQPEECAQVLRKYADKYHPAPRSGAEIVKDFLIETRKVDTVEA